MTKSPHTLVKEISYAVNTDIFTRKIIARGEKAPSPLGQLL